jgi:hypothetical protein
MFSSQQALPESIKNLEISNILDKELTSGLFTYFIEDKWYPYMFAANNKIVSRFKEQIRLLLVENDNHRSSQNISSRFLMGIDELFAKYLNEKRPQYKELDELLTSKESQTTVDEKIKILQYMHDYKFHKFNEKDDKFLYEYYLYFLDRIKVLEK